MRGGQGSHSGRLLPGLSEEHIAKAKGIAYAHRSQGLMSEKKDKLFSIFLFILLKKEKRAADKHKS